MTFEPSLLPSETRDRHWIESASPSGAWSDNSGKWLLFVPVMQIDRVWKIIDLETKAGQLGIAAKVATAKTNSFSTSNKVRLICVYTYDCNDLVDVRRVRQRLREIGFLKKIPYKTDAATAEGKYVRNGAKRVALLYE